MTHGHEADAFTVTAASAHRSYLLQSVTMAKTVDLIAFPLPTTTLAFKPKVKPVYFFHRSP